MSADFDRYTKAKSYKFKYELRPNPLDVTADAASADAGVWRTKPRSPT